MTKMLSLVPNFSFQPNGIKNASKSVKGIKSAFVQSQSCVVNDGEVTEYRVNLKVTFEVKD